MADRDSIQDNDQNMKSTCMENCHSPVIRGVVRSKKATLVLLWSTAIHFYYILSFVNPFNVPYVHIYTTVIFGVLLLLYPLSGWLADVYLTRYRAMFIGLCFVITGSCISTIVRFPYHQIELLGFIIAAIGQAFFEVNAIQFGLDQLETYSTENHKAFIYWFYWTIEIGHFLYGITVCSARQFYDHELGFNIATTIFSIIQIIALIAIGIQVCLWRNKFNQHPTGFHPFKLIFQILNYTRKKRISRHYSAFQYTDNEVATCLDRAKFKYGGPFSTEQVEDVKVFFYLLFILVPLSVVYYTDELYTVSKQFESLSLNDTVDYGKCLLTEVPNWIRSTLAVLLLPIYILFISQALNKITHHSWLLWRLGIGLSFTFVAIIALFGIQLYITLESISNNTYITSYDGSSCYVGDKVNFNWLIIPEFFNSLSYVVVFSTTLEFICAQSPYSIKGFLIGIWFAFQGFDIILLSIQQTFYLDCYFGYYIGKGLIMTGFIILYIYAAKQYRYRKRQDKDVRAILEDYYTIKDEESLEDGNTDNISADDLTYNTLNIMKY